MSLGNFLFSNLMLMCHLGPATGCPDIWLDMISGCFWITLTFISFNWEKHIVLLSVGGILQTFEGLNKIKGCRNGKCTLSLSACSSWDIALLCPRTGTTSPVLLILKSSKSDWIHTPKSSGSPTAHCRLWYFQHVSQIFKINT